MAEKTGYLEGTPLFEDPPKTGPHGSFYEKIYNKYKKYGFLDNIALITPVNRSPIDIGLDYQTHRKFIDAVLKLCENVDYNVFFLEYLEAIPFERRNWSDYGPNSAQKKRHRLIAVVIIIVIIVVSVFLGIYDTKNQLSENKNHSIQKTENLGPRISAGLTNDVLKYYSIKNDSLPTLSGLNNSIIGNNYEPSATEVKAYLSYYGRSEKGKGLKAADPELPDFNNIHIWIGYKCPPKKDILNSSYYNLAKFQEASLKSYILIYKEENNIHKCLDNSQSEN